MYLYCLECRKYCEKELHRKFVPKYWQPLTVKIAIWQAYALESGGNLTLFHKYLWIFLWRCDNIIL